jgi:hypothetical protein
VYAAMLTCAPCTTRWRASLFGWRDWPAMDSHEGVAEARSRVRGTVIRIRSVRSAREGHRVHEGRRGEHATHALRRDTSADDDCPR